MICPACGEEYEADQVARCPWCGGHDGAHEPDPPPDDDDLGPLVRVAEVPDAVALAAATSALEQAGIPCFVQGADPLRGLGLSTLMRGEILEPERREILVPEALLAEAARILDRLPSRRSE